MGALGTGIAETLARCGVGRLILVDRDYVEWSNLQRQRLYTEEDARVRTPKAAAARTRLMAVNSEIVIEAHVLDVRAEELESLLPGVDLIMDGTDNFDTRLIINDLAQKHGIPWIYGACVGSYGITYTILPGRPLSELSAGDDSAGRGYLRYGGDSSASGAAGYSEWNCGGAEAARRI